MIYSLILFNHDKEYLQANAELIELLEMIKQNSMYVEISSQRDRSTQINISVTKMNEIFAQELEKKGWERGIKIPGNYSALGKEFDFGKSQTLLEIQFSHYAFFYNNLIRFFLVYSKEILELSKYRNFILICRVNRIKSANSSLYYEQAIKMYELCQNILKIPLVIIGLDMGKEEKGIMIKKPHQRSRSGLKTGKIVGVEE
jgi:hypothetical protein